MHLGHCQHCSNPISLEDLRPVYRTQIALMNLIESVGLSDMMIQGDDTYEVARPGWSAFLQDTYKFIERRTFEVGEFGAAFDKDGPLDLGEDIGG